MLGGGGGEMVKGGGGVGTARERSHDAYRILHKVAPGGALLLLLVHDTPGEGAGPHEVGVQLHFHLAEWGSR